MYNYNVIKSKIILEGKTIKEISKNLNLNEQTISNWINGRNTKNIENFLNLLDYLDIDIKDIKNTT